MPPAGGLERWPLVQVAVLSESGARGRVERPVPSRSWVSALTSASLSAFRAELEHFIPIFFQNDLLLHFGTETLETEAGEAACGFHSPGRSPPHTSGKCFPRKQRLMSALLE